MMQPTHYAKTQTNFMESAKVLESKLENKELFLDIIKQVQLPAVQVSVQTIEEEKAMEGKMYQELTTAQTFAKLEEDLPKCNRTVDNFSCFHVLHFI